MKCELLRLLGYQVDWYEGELRFFGQEPPADTLDAMDSLPDNEIEFVGVNLGALKCEGADLIRSYQCCRIRSLRREAYAAKEITPEAYMNIQIDGGDLGAFGKLRDEIKIRYPWPGNYR